MTLVLGIDPGHGNHRLWAGARPGGWQPSVAYIWPPFRPRQVSQPHQRLSLLFHQLTDLLLLHRPDSCAVEKLFFQSNVKTAIAVGQARGVVSLAISEAGLEMGEYTPNEVKQAVAGYGSAGKKQVQEMVRVLLGLPEIPKPDDAADALAIAITHLHTWHF